MPEVISIAQPVRADEESVSPPPKKRAVPVFVQGLGIPPVPGRLVEKILDGQFVDMAELLPDNIELLRRERSSSDSKARLRQISSITAWAQCFATFVAIRAQAAPATVLALLAYMRLLIREAARHPGLGWLSYDSFFRQQAIPSLGFAALGFVRHYRRRCRCLVQPRPSAVPFVP